MGSVAAESALAAFPGTNGAIAFTSTREPGVGDEIWVIESDGSGLIQLTDRPGLLDAGPAWSPDGRRIAFYGDPCAGCGENVREIFAMNADGTDRVRLTTNAVDDLSPAWSPDGTKIAFEADREGTCTGCNREIYTMNADGSGRTQLTDRPGSDSEPAWSPSGRKIVFSSEGDIFVMNDDGTGLMRIIDGEHPSFEPSWSPDGQMIAFARFPGPYPANPDIYIANADGTHEQRLTENGLIESSPSWSPDGNAIVFHRRDASLTRDSLFVLNADGTGERQITSGASDYLPDWQPRPINYYPHPKAASPFKSSLVVAYEPCTAPDRMHGPPLSFESCSSPRKISEHLTVGTADSNQRPVLNAGYLRVSTLVGASGGVDDTDVALSFVMNDIFTDALADYAGQLRARVELQVTDKYNTPHPAGPGAATTIAIPLELTAACTPVADPREGSACATTTTADALAPGTANEGDQAIWELGRVEVYDGGPDGRSDTPVGDTLFATQGVFVP
jgi:TolB protein